MTLLIFPHPSPFSSVSLENLELRTDYGNYPLPFFFLVHLSRTQISIQVFSNRSDAPTGCRFKGDTPQGGTRLDGTTPWRRTTQVNTDPRPIPRVGVAISMSTSLPRRRPPAVNWDVHVVQGKFRLVFPLGVSGSVKILKSTDVSGVRTRVRSTRDSFGVRHESHTPYVNF